MINILNTKGMVNAILSMMGRESINFLGSVDLFKPLLYVTENWKSGWTMIIYLAAISGINTEQYESAIMTVHPVYK